MHISLIIMSSFVSWNDSKECKPDPIGLVPRFILHNAKPHLNVREAHVSDKESVMTSDREGMRMASYLVISAITE